MVLGISTVTSKGQITLPKLARDKMGISQGQKVTFSLEDNSLIIRPHAVSADNLRGRLKAYQNNKPNFNLEKAREMYRQDIIRKHSKTGNNQGNA